MVIRRQPPHTSHDRIASSIWLPAAPQILCPLPQDGDNSWSSPNTSGDGTGRNLPIPSAVPLPVDVSVDVRVGAVRAAQRAGRRRRRRRRVSVSKDRSAAITAAVRR
jgi:hypothetical protein